MVLTKDDLTDGDWALSSALHALRAGEAKLELPSGECHTLSPRVAAFIAEALELASAGGAVLIDQGASLSPSEAAAMLGVSRPMIYRWIKEGLLEDRPVNAAHRVPISSVEALMEQRRLASRRAVSLLATAPDSPRVQAARERALARRARRDA